VDIQKTSASEQLRSKAKKLEMLATLLDDREIASELKGILTQVGTAPEAPPTTRPVQTQKPIARRRASSRRRRGALSGTVYLVIQQSTKPMTARDVTIKMEQDGYTFSAKDHQVAVSKVLRTLAEGGKIHAEKSGDHDKSPIFYSRISTQDAQRFPVREIA
jgi:hypothetical protein